MADPAALRGFDALTCSRLLEGVPLIAALDAPTKRRVCSRPPGVGAMAGPGAPPLGRRLPRAPAP